MPVYDTYSKRIKRRSGRDKDVYQYDRIPKEFRVQVVHILLDIFGEGDTPSSHGMYSQIERIICREYGLMELPSSGNYSTTANDVIKYFVEFVDTNHAIDIIEISFNLIYAGISNYQINEKFTRKIKPEEAIAELNIRFFENGLGYQFESGIIVRVDKKYIHSEIIKPALSLLTDEIYEGANAEFLSALENFKKRNYKDCINDCLKSFESTMKIICAQNNWEYIDSDTAKKLLEICFTNGLIPDYLQSYYSALRSTLESGVPSTRNKKAGHGQGGKIIKLPPYLASYIVNLTATSIILLIEANQDKRQ